MASDRQRDIDAEGQRAAVFHANRDRQFQARHSIELADRRLQASWLVMSATPEQLAEVEKALGIGAADG